MPHLSASSRRILRIPPCIFAIGLVLVTSMALAVRVRWLGESLWVDELHTAWAVQAAWSRLLERCWEGNQLPGYFVLVKVVTDTWGPSEYSLRSVSVVAGTATVIGLSLIVRGWTGSAVLGLLTAVLAAWDRHLVFYAVEARPYALVQLVSVIQLALFYRLLHDASRRRRVTWIGLNGVLFFLHPTSGLLLLAAVCAYMLSRRWVPQSNYRPSAFAWDTSLSVVLWLPAFPYLLHLAARRDNWSHLVVRTGLVDAWTLFPLTWNLLFPMLVVGVWMLGFRKQPNHVPAKHPDWLPTALLVSCSWLLVPLLSAWILSSMDVARILLRRYLLAAAVPLAALPALMGGYLPAGNQRVLFAVATGAIVVWQAGPWPEWQRRTHEDWRGLVAALNQQWPHHPYPVLLRSGLIEAQQLDEEMSAHVERQNVLSEQLGEYLLYPLNALYALDVPRQDRHPLGHAPSGLLPESALQQMRDRGGVWLVMRARAGPIRDAVDQRDIMWHLEQQLSPLGLRRQAVERFGVNLALVRWE